MPGVVRQEELPAASVFSFADLEAQGRQILRRARKQAADILRSARRRAAGLAERDRQAGYQAGITAGRAAGLEQIRAEAHEAAVREAREQVAALTGALGGALAEFEQGKRGCLAAAESGLIELALAIARRVCKLEAGASASAAQANARSLLDRVQHTADVELLFNPAEYELLREMAPQFLAQSAQLKHVELLASEEVSRGGCLLRTQEGQIDATIETQLQRIAAALRIDADGGQAAAAPVRKARGRRHG